LADFSAPSRIRTCGLLLRREALYRRGNLVPTRKSLQIDSFSKGHEKSRRSTSHQWLFPLCSHLRGVRLHGDTGARALLKRARVVEVACDGLGSAADIDTPEDLEALR
jgi:hypothetical protein